MTLNLGTLNAVIDADDKGFNRGIDKAAAKMAGFQRDANGRLRDMKGHFVKEGEAMGEGLGQGIQKRAAEGVDGIWRDAQGKLRTAKGRFIKEGTLLGEGLGDGVEKGSKKGLGGLSRNLDEIHGKMAKVTKKFGGLQGILSGLGRATAFAGIATGAAGAASALGPLLSLVSTLGVTLVGLGAAVPAFAVAGAAAAGALTIAFTGLGDAIGGDEEALERLAGPARDFVGVIEDLKPAWEDLTKGVQGAFFDDLSDTFREVAGKVLPRLKDGLETVASGLGDVAKAGLRAADSPRFLAGMDAVLEHTGAGFRALSTGVDGWVSGFGTLMSAFAPLIEQVGVALGNLGDRFGAWMDRAQETGQLQQIIQTMLDTLSTLAGIVQNVGSIFGSVFSAANESGGGLLGVIEDLTGRLDEFFKSAEGQEALQSFFSSLAAVADAVAPIVLEIAEAIGEDLAPKFAEIAEEVGPVFADLVSEIGDAIGDIDVKALAEGLADVLEAIIPLVDPLGKFLGSVSEIDGIVPIVVGALVAWTVAQWALNAAMYANPIVWIIALVIALIAVIALIVVNWDSVVASLKYSWDMFVEGLQIAFNAVKDFFIQWWPELLAIFTAGGSLIVGWIIDHWDEIKAFTSNVWNAIKDFFSGVWDQMVAIAETQVAATLAVIGWFKELPGKISAWFGGVKDAAVDKLTALVDWVKGLPGRIKDAIGNLGSLLYNAGRDILQGLLDGISSMWDSVQNKLGDLTSSLPDWKGPEAVDKKLLVKPGQWVIGGLIEGIDSMIPTVQRTLQGLTTDIGLQVDGAAAPGGARMRVDATAALADEDRQLLRKLAESRNQMDIRLGANLTAASQREYAMAVA